MVVSAIISGLHQGGCGRSCERHGVCGEYITVGDVVTLHEAIVYFGGPEPQSVVAVVRQDTGCRIGWLAKEFLSHRKDLIAEGSFEITAIHKRSVEKEARRAAYLKYGSAEITSI